MHKTVTLGVAAAMMAALVTPVAATADSPVSTSVGEGSMCPRLHVVMIQDATTSMTTTGQDADGLLGEVVTPVISAANGGYRGDDSAGFVPPTSSPEPTSAVSADSWKPNVWGDNSSASPSASDGGDWKPDVWGASSLSTATLPTSETTSIVPTTSAHETTASHSKEAGKVGKTVIRFGALKDTAAYLPTDPAPEETYDGQLAKAVADTDSVLEQIAFRCPNTQVALLGMSQGAQAASEVAKAIGAGESSFPADRLVGVALFADPSRSAGQPVTASGDLHGDVVGIGADDGEGIARTVGATSPSDRGFGELSNRTVSWCVDGDARCGMKKAAPLERLTALAHENTATDPQDALRFVGDVLIPAVSLGTVESLADDVSFGSQGFTFARSGSVDDTLIGRITAAAETPVSQSEHERRLVAAGQKIGGMGLAAGITIAKKAITPQNIAAVSAASAASTAAAAAMAGAILAKSAVEVLTPATATSAAMRVVDEAKAAGIEPNQQAEAAIEAAVSRTVTASDSAYRTRPVMASGASASGATTSWLADTAVNALGDDAPPELVQLATVAAPIVTSAFDAALTTNAMDSIA